MRAAIFGVLGTLAILASCHPPHPVTPPPDLEDDASRAPTCASYCSHMRRLDCEQGKPTPKGATCETVCLNVQQSGFVKLDLRCGYSAPTCAAASACEN